MKKYLDQAFVRMMLVVIGITIVLSINNWNEERMQNEQLRGCLK